MSEASNGCRVGGGERVRAGDAERVAQRNRREPLNLGLAGFGARDVNVHAGPRVAAVCDGELHVDRAVVSNRGSPFRLNANP